MATFPHFTHLALFPHTGRTHQLRVHLSEGGYPIVGDPLYGRRPRGLSLSPELEALLAETKETFLHAKAITLTHPVIEKELHLEARRPPRFEAFLELLRVAKR